MKRFILPAILALATGFFCLSAQQPAAGRGAQPAQGQAAQGQPAQAQPNPEQQALADLIAARNKGDLDAISKAAEALVMNFPQSQYREAALTLEANAYQEKGDVVKAQAIFQRVLDINPRSIAANLTIGELITQQTHDNDFDLAAKITSAEKHFRTTLDLLNGQNPNPQASEQQWQAAKQSFGAEVHNGLGMLALFRKTYDVAVQEFQLAATGVNEPAYMARLAHAQQLAGKNDDSIATCDKLLADPQLLTPIKNLVTTVRANAVKAKSAAK